MMSLIFFAVLGALAFNLDDPPEGPVISVGIPDALFGEEYMQADSLVSGYECIRMSSCPGGLLLLNTDGNVLGCTAALSELSATCSGNCYTCDGINSPTWVCVANPLKSCSVPEVHRIVGCGSQRKHSNACVSTQPAGVPTTPNGCYCDTTIGFIYLLYDCTLAECQ
jgi:hypothetical protein